MRPHVKLPVQMPWHLPRAVYYATPWAWMRLYARLGDAVLFRLWFASRPLFWRLDDLARALDAATLARAQAIDAAARRARGP